MANVFFGAELVFWLTTSLALFSQVVFVFGFVKLKEVQVKNIFKMFFFANLLFSVSQVAILTTTLINGFDFSFFITINAFFSFLLAVFLMITIREAQLFSKKLVSGGYKSGN